jgi:hypothetical protein
MKKIKNIILAMVGLLTIASCGTDADTVAEVKGEAGFTINVTQSSSGALLGSPESGVEIEDASVAFSDASLNLMITSVSGSLEDVEKIEIVKFFNGDLETSGDSAGSVVAETTSLPFTFSYSTISEFLEGTGVSESDLRIGDYFTFRVRVVKKDGEVYYFNSGMGRFQLTINCSYDLNGTYTMTNSVCSASVTVAISQNSDGTWYAETADGGLLQFCSTNTTIQNDGSFAVGCGGVVTAIEGGPAYCEGGGYGIGCITGGTWDQENGVLNLEHSDVFFSWSGGTYTSTYVRQ